MIPRRKKRNIIIVTVIILILIIVGVLVFLYMTTDAFKSKDRLFAKYLVQNFSIIDEFQKFSEMEEVDQLLENNKYTSTINGNINYVLNKGLDGENSNNPINNIQLNIESQTDKANKYDYKDIKLVKQDENLIRAEYINIDDIYGIRFDKIKQFVSLDIKNKNTNEQEGSMTLIEDLKQIDLNNMKEIFTKEEENALISKYLNIIMSNLNEQNFSKKSNSVIKINNSSTNTNAYSITLNKEQFNNIYIKILEEAKQDDIILEKIEQLNEQIKNVSKNDTTQDLKQSYINSMDNIIEKIRNTNIGQEQRKITVYEKNGQTVRTQIDTDEEQLTIDRITNKSGIWLEIYYKKQSQKENSCKINIMITTAQDEVNKYFGVEIISEGILNNHVELSNTRKMQNNNVQSEIEIKAYNDKNEMTVTIDVLDTIVNDFEEKIELSTENNVNFEELDELQRNNVIKAIQENIQNQVNKLQEDITLQDIINMFVNVNLIKESSTQLYEIGIVTEAEKNRFNNMFEFYQGEELEKENIEKMMSVVKDHLKEIKIMEYEEDNNRNEQQIPKTFLIVIEKDKKNEELANLLLKNLENERNSDKYSVKVEYNETTGLIEHIILSKNE